MDRLINFKNYIYKQIKGLSVYDWFFILGLVTFSLLLMFENPIWEENHELKKNKKFFMDNIQYLIIGDCWIWEKVIESVNNETELVIECENNIMIYDFYEICKESTLGSCVLSSVFSLLYHITHIYKIFIICFFKFIDFFCYHIFALHLEEIFLLIDLDIRYVLVNFF